MYSYLLRTAAIASLFFGAQAHADNTDVQVLSECTERLGDDPTLVRRSTIAPGVQCADETAYDITASIVDAWLGFVQHVRAAPGVAHMRERQTLASKQIIDNLWACQKVSPDGKIVNEWFVTKGKAKLEACKGRDIGTTLYRRYIRETNPDTGAHETRACLVLSKSKSECKLLSWFAPEAQKRVRESLARADKEIAQIRAKRMAVLKR